MGVGQESCAALTVHGPAAPREGAASLLVQEWPPDPLHALCGHWMPPGLPAAGAGADRPGEPGWDGTG